MPAWTHVCMHNAYPSTWTYLCLVSIHILLSCLLEIMSWLLALRRKAPVWRHCPLFLLGGLKSHKWHRRPWEWIFINAPVSRRPFSRTHSSLRMWWQSKMKLLWQWLLNFCCRWNRWQGSALSCCHPWILAGLQKPCADYHNWPRSNLWLTWVHRHSSDSGPERVTKASNYNSLSFLLRAMGEVNGCRLLIALYLFYTLITCLWVSLEVGLVVFFWRHMH